MKPSLAIAIVGATASGKTAVSLEVSQLLKSEIISADSRQVYRYLDIGTAKPNKAEQQICKHNFIDILNPDEPFNAGIFADSARELILNHLVNNDITPIIVGGSGLYVRSLCEGIFSESPPIEISDVRSKLEDRLLKEGKDSLYQELIVLDSISAEKYIDKNPRRIIRALEYFYTTGIPISQAHLDNPTPNIPFKTLYFGIDHPRDILYQYINKRCVEMWDNGLPEETESIVSMGYSQTLNSLNTVGYKETMNYLGGGFTAEEAILAMQQSTRNYAKRQLTWFGKNKDVVWLTGTTNAIAHAIVGEFRKVQSLD